MDPETRESLIARLPNHADSAAWNEFVELYEPLIYGIGRRHGLQPADAGDLVQEVLASVASAIREKQTALFQVEDAKAKDKLLHELRALYTKRFEIDTAYQDFKMREIERRAKKLRAEVNAREKAADNWVEAMVTLAKMRADGIETMDSLATPAVSTQRGAFSTGVLSGSVNAVPSRDNFPSFGQPNTRMTNSEVPAAPARVNRNPSSFDAPPFNAPRPEPYRN